MYYVFVLNISISNHFFYAGCLPKNRQLIALHKGLGGQHKGSDFLWFEIVGHGKPSGERF